MELQVDIDEADVGKVRVGQKATFSVDAYPDRKFPASIRDIRFGSEVVQGVVTYKAVLSIDNAELMIRPGMTATAEVVIEQVNDTLLVPNAALRFSPASAWPEKEKQGPAGSPVAEAAGRDVPAAERAGDERPQSPDLGPAQRRSSSCAGRDRGQRWPQDRDPQRRHFNPDDADHRRCHCRPLRGVHSDRTRRSRRSRIIELRGVTKVYGAGRRGGARARRR